MEAVLGIKDQEPFSYKIQASGIGNNQVNRQTFVDIYNTKFGMSRQTIDSPQKVRSKNKSNVNID